MQTFIDTTTQKVYQLDDDVTMVTTDGVNSFVTSHGQQLTSLPTTLKSYVMATVPTAARVIPAEQQIYILENSITARRVREAVLTGDHTFIQSVETQIAALRSTLPAV